MADTLIESRLPQETAHEGNGYHVSEAPAPVGGVRLNLGAGAIHCTGWENIDRHTGQEVYPLAHPTNSVEEILASHILEHFGHREAALVLFDWVRALKPGGKIRLAVPDFEKVCRDYLEGKVINVQGYVMGGHNDENDRHGCIFDRESLTELMASCGLERIGVWKSDMPGCSQLEHSLNLQGFMPVSPGPTKLENVKACMSVPRFGPLMHPRCVERALFRLRIEVKAASSCFWHQKLSDLMEECIADPSCQYVLTMDYDTIFSASDVLELYRLMQVYPEADAIVPAQSKRNNDTVLFSLADGQGGFRKSLNSAELERNLLPLYTGHFGLTLFRADALRKFERPWMVPKPSPDGKWDDGQIDVDIDFWMHFRKCGFKPFVAPRVVVGHLAEVILWPGKDLKPIYQGIMEYEENGIPGEVVR